MVRILPGLLLALGLAIIGHYLANLIGITWMGLPKSPVSPIMMAILLGILIRNVAHLPDWFDPGIRFSLVRILRLGIILLGIRLSLSEMGDIGLKSLPVIIGCVTVALLTVSYISKRIGLSARLGTLIAAGTGICGATAIVALAPTIKAKHDEVAYAVACITIFGVIAMLVYPFAAHWMFAADSFRSGLFLGTAVHETAQVAGAGLVYQEYFDDTSVLNTATVTKLVRNLGMLVVIPLMSIVYHRSEAGEGQVPKWWTMIPLFVVGFALMSLLRTVGDMGDMAFGVLEPEQWKWLVSTIKKTAEIFLGIAMAAVGLGTSLAGLRKIGIRPFGVGLFSALLVGVVSYLLISLLY